ncbi:MAG: DNA internalization-related competence protein ComEC/Rec2 [Magnetococcales bacterium]|nr:DNA internalization-related competence protein ComEC/Rec2 [Magnetococcales bacterium]
MAMIGGIILCTHTPLAQNDLHWLQVLIGLATWLTWLGSPAGRTRWLRLLGGLFLGVVAANWEDWQACNPPLLLPEGKKGKEFTAMVVDRNDRDDSIQLILEDFVWQPEQTEFAGQIQLSIYGHDADAEPGDRIAGKAVLHPVEDYRVPGVFSYADMLRRQGVKANGSARDPPQVVEQTSQWRINRLRQRISAWVQRHIAPRQQGLVEGILVGKRGRITAAQNENMRSAGLIHLVAISGSNLGLVAGWAFLFFRRLLVMLTPVSRRWDVKRLAALAAMLFMLGYASLAGWSVATQRAAIMITLYLLSVAVERGNQMWRALGMSAILILFFQPNQLFQAGFQLSFLAVATLIALGDMDFAPDWRGRMRAMSLSTITIGVVLTPVTAYHFHQGSPYSILANIPAIPWVGIVSVPLGMIGLMVLPWSETWGGVVLSLMGWSLEIFDRWAAWISHLPGAWTRFPGPTLPGFALMVLAGVGWLAWRRFWPRAACLCVAACAWFWPHPAPPLGYLQLSVLDVRQGQSVLLHAPTGDWSVIDAGGPVSPRFNIGESVISANLWYQGVGKLARIVLSHPDLDHISGAAQLLRNFPTGELWLGFFPQEEESHAQYKQIIAMAQRQGTLIRRFQDGTTIHAEGLDFHILPPFPLRGKENDRSLVLEVTHDTRRFLFPGDVQRTGERWLARSGQLAPVTLVVAPHHGSAGSSSPIFVQALHPEHVVFSVGARNRYGFPKPASVARWAASGARLWRTDQDGTVMFRSDGHHLERVGD